ncbi:uncharacterized protein K452DRAFT_310189 [Aplosporella prunicola CBS 121167]|uniref:Nuclease PA3 n=1 Tax=Aplosporella prunicola CBS 121167 TaxID=1176127 RepID=A0A6A6B8W6_9PEZI|nr:uncharacterized protein K452DRAFT_310189 [Aplosporella prunicola CBS 121167]KAF2139803.1 hypothetical protein K452DRAFT_310189 [Aplosporella prunicola CBS 121167]
MLPRTLLLGSLLTVSVSAWNTDVHQQIGYTAETFLTPHAANVLGQILEPQYNGSIGNAAAWADAYAHTDEGAFSYQWHWIDSADDPPAYCNVYYNRDCSKGGCIVSAIANQTEILRECIAEVEAGSYTAGANLTCSYALKWVTHFLGDIAQPLHASGIAAGGNNFKVIFNNVSTELHAVWDGWIIYQDAGVTRFSNTTISPFFSTNLLPRIKKDLFFEPTASWLACTDPATPIECALAWARDSNSWTCDYTYSQNYNATDLATSGYSVGAYPIVELQVSKAALRLGTWLNRLVAEYKQDRGLVLQTNPSWIGGPNEGK